MSKDSNRDYQEIANQIGLATYGGVAFQANPEYVEQIGKIFHQELQKARADWTQKLLEKLELLTDRANDGLDTESYISVQYYLWEVKDFITELDQPLPRDVSK